MGGSCSKMSSETDAQNTNGDESGQGENPLVPPSQNGSNSTETSSDQLPPNSSYHDRVAKRKESSHSSEKGVPFIERNHANAIINEVLADEKSVDSSSLLSDAKCEATLEIFVSQHILLGGQRASAASLRSWTGNTDWLFDNLPSIVPLETIMPQQVQLPHMKWVTTLLLDIKNARGNWSALSVMLSRFIRIYNPRLQIEEKVSIQMNLIDIDRYAHKIVFQIQLQKLAPHVLEAANSTTLRRNTRLFPAPFLCETSSDFQKVAEKRKTIVVQIMPRCFYDKREAPCENELSFARMVLNTAPANTKLPAHYRLKRLCYTVTGESPTPMVLTHNYIKIGTSIYYEAYSSKSCVNNQEKIKKIVNIDTNATAAATNISGVSFFDNMSASLPFSASENIGRDDIVMPISYEVTLLLKADSFEALFSQHIENESFLEQSTISILDTDLKGFIENPPLVSDALLKKLPISLLRLMINLNTGKLSKQKQACVYENLNLEEIFVKINLEKIELNFGDDKNFNEVGCRYHFQDVMEQKFLSPEQLYHLYIRNVEIDSDLMHYITNFPNDGISSIKHDMWCSIESDGFTMGVILRVAINQLFNTPNLQLYKGDMLKIASLLGCCDPRGRPRLSTILTAYNCLYALSENMPQKNDYILVYGKLPSALIKLADFPQSQPNFYGLYTYIQRELNCAIDANGSGAMTFILQFINFFHYIRLSLRLLRRNEIDEIVNVFKYEVALINELILLSDYEFSPPNDKTRFMSNFHIIATIMAEYNAAKKHTPANAFFKKPNTTFIINTIDTYKQTLCDLTKEELGAIISEINCDDESVCNMERNTRDSLY